MLQAMRISIVCLCCLFTTLSYAQTPQEIAYKIIQSDDYLEEGIDQLYAYQFQKRYGDGAIKVIAEIHKKYDFELVKSSVLKNTASVQFRVISKEDPVKISDIYFLFKKEERKWRIHDFLEIDNSFTNYHYDLLKAVALYREKDYKI
jgi:hypothetical protein